MGLLLYGASLEPNVYVSAARPYVVSIEYDIGAKLHLEKGKVLF